MTAIAVVLSLAGCRGTGPSEVWPVGTCVRVSADGATAAVSCAEPHTHKVIATVDGDGQKCPSETVLYVSPADPDDGRTTTCLRADAAG